MNTKEKILHESLKLFAQKGYEAVGVAEIAEKIGIKAPSLYKHYQSKQDIFHCILRRMEEMDSEQAKNYGMPEECEQQQEFVQKQETSCLSLSVEQMKQYSKAMLLHWTTEEFSCNFRRLLTLEQYHSEQMRDLYQQYLSGGPVRYMAEIFAQGTETSEQAYELAVQFYAPMHLFYSLYDGGEDAVVLLKLLEEHIDCFFAREFGKNLKNDIRI